MKALSGKGKHNTRETILNALKSSRGMRVQELADAADVSPVTVRHHLNALQADNLIEVNTVRRKVGRPYYLYGLSESGHELFPKKYLRLTDRLLEELKVQLPPETVTELFSGIGQGILAEHEGRFENLPIEERLNYAIDLLSEEGFLARWERLNGQYILTEFSCPYGSLVDRHSEICLFDRQLITNVLQRTITQTSCMVDGDNCCEFTFPADAAGQ